MNSGWLEEAGGKGVWLHSHFLADQLTLLQLEGMRGGGDYAHQLLVAHPVRFASTIPAIA